MCEIFRPKKEEKPTESPKGLFNPAEAVSAEKNAHRIIQERLAQFRASSSGLTSEIAEKVENIKVQTAELRLTPAERLRRLEEGNNPPTNRG